MSRSKAIGAALAISLGVVAPASAQAPIVVIAAGDADAVVVTRLASELVALGFEPVIEQSTAEDRTALEALARAANAIAAIAIVPSLHGAEVWVVDRVTGKATLRNVVVSDEDDQGVTLALRSVELLRASLMELRAPHPSRGEVAAPPAVERVATPEPEPIAFDFEAGAAASIAPDGLTVAWHVSLGVGFMPHPIVGLHITALIPVVPAHATGPEGEADLFPALVGGGIRLQATLGRLRGRADLGLAAAILATTGRAAPPYISRSDTVYAAVPYVKGALSWLLAGPLWIKADVTIGVAAPRPIVMFGGRQVATWGRPVLILGLGSGVDLY